MEYLIKHINKTNELTKTKDGKTISEMIAEKDVLSKKLSILGSYIDSASATTTRLTHTEIKILSAFSCILIPSSLKFMTTSYCVLQIVVLKNCCASYLPSITNRSKPYQIIFLNNCQNTFSTSECSIFEMVTLIHFKCHVISFRLIIIHYFFRIFLYFLKIYIPRF